MPLGAVIHEYKMVVNGMNYFLRDALKFRLGDYGEKKQPAGKMYLQNQGSLVSNLTNVRADGVQISFEKSSHWSLEAGFKVVDEDTTYEVNAGVAQDKLSKGELVLVKFEVPLMDLRNAVIGKPGAVNNLQALGADARVVCAIFQIVSSSVYNKLTTSVSIDFTYTPQSGTSFSVKMPPSGGGPTTTVTYAAGSTLAYLLAKPHWTKKQLTKLTTDQFGTG